MEIPRFERCWCTGVVRADAVAAIRQAKCRTLDELRRASGACFGCQSCRPELERLLKEDLENAEKGTERMVRGVKPEADGAEAPSSEGQR